MAWQSPPKGRTDPPGVLDPAKNFVFKGNLVGASGFEPDASCAQGLTEKRSTLCDPRRKLEPR